MFLLYNFIIFPEKWGANFQAQGKIKIIKVDNVSVTRIPLTRTLSNAILS